MQQELESDGVAIAKKADLTKAIDKHTFAEESLGAKLQTAYKLLAEEKTLKAELKTQSAELHSKTKAAIEALDDAEALALLRQKWFVPLNAAMRRLPENMLAQFSQKLTALCANMPTPISISANANKKAPPHWRNDGRTHRQRL